MQTWKYSLVLDIKKKNNFKLFYYYIYTYCRISTEIPTNQGANTYKLKISKIGNYNQFIQQKRMTEYRIYGFLNFSGIAIVYKGVKVTGFYLLL